MKIIVHRRNLKAELISTPQKFGIEVDIRSRDDELITHHDPFVRGTLFSEWIDGYSHGTLILNVKEEGLEARLISMMAAVGFDDYFFLDQSFPFLVKWANAGERRCAVRVSEFESVETALSLGGKVDWVWVDCFNRFPLTRADACRLNNAGFRLCLVSPELHGRDPITEIPHFVQMLSATGIVADAVCTKRPDLWEHYR
jgi:hypothetical protein